jgi:hypothetical protein
MLKLFQAYCIFSIAHTMNIFLCLPILIDTKIKIVYYLEYWNVLTEDLMLYIMYDPLIARVIDKSELLWLVWRVLQPLFTEYFF